MNQGPIWGRFMKNKRPKISCYCTFKLSKRHLAVILLSPYLSPSRAVCEVLLVCSSVNLCILFIQDSFPIFYVLSCVLNRAYPLCTTCTYSLSYKPSEQIILKAYTKQSLLILVLKTKLPYIQTKIYVSGP